MAPMPATRRALETHKLENQSSVPLPQSQSARFWLLVLLLFSAAAAVGALFLQYKLEGLRASVLESAKSMTGAELTFRAVTVSGLRGLRVSDLKVTLRSEGGPIVTAEVPDAEIYIDAVDLLYGDVSIDRVQLDDAVITVERPEGSRWFSEGEFSLGGRMAAAGAGAFRLTGKSCRFEAKHVVADSSLTLSDFTFDISRLAESEEIDANFSGLLNGNAQQRLDIRASAASIRDFSLRATCSELTANDINVFLPASQQFVVQGVTQPNIRIDSYPGSDLIVLSLSAPIQDISLREQPTFLQPTTSGTLTLLANYDVSTSLLTFLTAQADSDELRGSLEGSISFADEKPVFALALDATRFPVAAIVAFALAQRTDELGELTVSLQEPCVIHMELNGSSETPAFSGAVRASGADVSLKPKTTTFPEGRLTLGASEITWNNESKTPTGFFSIVDGSLAMPKSSLKATHLNGMATLEEGKVKFDALSAEITGNPFVASLEFDWAAKAGTFGISGTLSDLEGTPLNDGLENTRFSGSVGLRYTGEFRPKSIVATGEIDATQAEIAHEWWFKKPVGIGAKGKVAIKYVPRDSIDIKISDAEVASSQLGATARVTYVKPGWMLQTVTANSPKLDIVGTGKCLSIPYVLTGTTATKGYYQWNRIDNQKLHSNSSIGCEIGELTALAEGAAEPVVIRDATVAVELTRNVDDRTGLLNVQAASAVLPKLGSAWFKPLESPLELRDRYPTYLRDWSYTVNAKHLTLPPWIGSDFAGNGQFGTGETSLKHYTATVDGGRIEGDYLSRAKDNTYETSAKWSEVPSSYFIKYLNLPPLLSGTMTGEVSYAADRDDPRSRAGSGTFDIKDGKFSADYLIPWIEGKMENSMTVLPPSLKFSLFRSDIAFERDIIKTPRLLLESPGFKIEANGQFVTDGDLDYELNLSLSPEMAGQIDLLKTYFNIQGHRLAQQNIDLAFRISGPTFNPQGQLAQSPGATVTLLSGALEVTNEALQVIDLPRRLLLDLLRVGGGIVRPTS